MAALKYNWCQPSISDISPPPIEDTKPRRLRTWWKRKLEEERHRRRMQEKIAAAPSRHHASRCKRPPTHLHDVGHVDDRRQRRRAYPLSAFDTFSGHLIWPMAKIDEGSTGDMEAHTKSVADLLFTSVRRTSAAEYDSRGSMHVLLSGSKCCTRRDE